MIPPRTPAREPREPMGRKASKGSSRTAAPIHRQPSGRSNTRPTARGTYRQ